MIKFNQKQLYRKRLLAKIKQREQLLLKSRLKQQQDNNYILLKKNDEEYNKALCDRKRKRYSSKEYLAEAKYYQIMNKLDVTNYKNTNLTFHDLMDAMNFLEIGMTENFDRENVEDCLIPWLNTEKVKSFYMKVDCSEKEMQLLQLRAFSIILICTPLKNMDLKLCVEKHSPKGLSLVECVINLEEVKIEDLGKIACLEKIVTETGLYNIIDENLIDLFNCTEVDEIEEFICYRVLNRIEHSRYFNESCRFFTFCWKDELPREFNYDSFFQQLKNVDSSIDVETSFPIKSVLIQCFSMKNDNLQEFINNGLWDIIKKLKFSYRDNVEALYLIYDCIGFKPLVESPLFIECLKSVPAEDEDYEDIVYVHASDDIRSHYSPFKNKFNFFPCEKMFNLLRKIIQNEEIDNMKAVFTKDFFNFIRNHLFDDSNESNLELLEKIITCLILNPNETKEIQEENSEIIEWMKVKVKKMKEEQKRYRFNINFGWRR